MYYLTVLDGPAFGKEFVIVGEGEITVGRTGENDIVLPDHSLSRHHAAFWIENQRLWVQDLASKNGLYVNDERIRKKCLAVGDIVRIGTSSLKVGAEARKFALESFDSLAMLVRYQVTPII